MQYPHRLLCLSPLFIILLLVTTGSHAQYFYKSSTSDSIGKAMLPATKTTNAAVAKPKKPKLLRTEISFGAKLTTNGWGILMDKAWVKKDPNKYEKHPDQFYNTSVLRVEFGETFHSKEYSVKNEDLNGIADQLPKSFKYGKINNFYTLRLDYGFRKMIAGKPEPGNVSVHWFGMGGLALGMLKPYYIDVLSLNSYSSRSIKYEDDTQNDFLNSYLVIGRSSLLKGIGETKFIPGLNLQSGFHFDYSKKKKGLAAVEVGANADIYSQKIQIMAEQPAHQYNFNIFASIQFGGRW